MKRLFKYLIIIILVVIIGSNLPYRYNNNLVVNYITEHSNERSKCMCAWYCMKAIHRGGCFQCPILPAYAYNKVLPQLGYQEINIKNYVPIKGDIVVLPQNNKSVFGHIAIWNGNQWISDYKQKDIFPNNCYRDKGEYQIFRNSDGWHWAHINISPKDYYNYISNLIQGKHKIKWF
ncbi:MAG: CHAP domain-containing protein [Prevotella sp.]|nr:CHAP domain-containing protein [Prevotella sp.]